MFIGLVINLISTYIKEEKVQEPQKPQKFFNYSVKGGRERERERERERTE